MADLSKYHSAKLSLPAASQSLQAAKQWFQAAKLSLPAAILFLSLPLYVVLPALAASTDSILSASHLIDIGKVDAAKQMLYRELKQDPHNASAHYLLGNVYLRLRNPDDAVREFTYVTLIDPQSHAAKLSRLALFSIDRQKNHPANLAKPTSLDAKTKDETAGGAKEHKSPSTVNENDEEQARITTTAGKISSAVSERQHELTAEYATEKSRIEKDADTKIEALQTEMKAKMDENGPGWYRGGAYYNPSSLNNAIRKQYEDIIKDVRQKAQANLDQLAALYRTKADALEQSAIGLGQSFTQSKGNVVLSPVGSNMFVRNYQTNDTPSGEPPARRASPALPLPSR